MIDYMPLPSTNNTLADPDPDEDQPTPAPVTVDFVYNAHHDHNGTTIACKFAIQLPLQSSTGK